MKTTVATVRLTETELATLETIQTAQGFNLAQTLRYCIQVTARQTELNQAIELDKRTLEAAYKALGQALGC